MGAVKELYQKIVEEKIAWAARATGRAEWEIMKEWNESRIHPDTMVSIDEFLAKQAKK